MAEEKDHFWQTKTFKFWIAGIAAFVLVVAIAGGAYLGRTRQLSPTEALQANAGVKPSNTPQELIPIRTPTRKDCTVAPLLVADRQGFFAAEGLKLVFTGELQTAQRLAAILNGNNDLGDAHPNYLALSKASGAKVTAVARSIIEPAPDKDPQLRHMRWFVNASSGIKSFRGLKTVNDEKVKISAISKNSCAEFLGNKVADANDLPREKLEWIVMPDIQAIQAVKQGILTVAGVHPPFYKAAKDAGLVQIADSSDAGLGEAAGVYLYYFSDDFIQKNPDTVKRFVRAITKAQNWANANLAQTAKLTEEFIGVPVTGNHYYSDTTKIDEAQITPWIDDLENSGVLAKGAVKPSDLVSHAFEQ